MAWLTLGLAPRGERSGVTQQQVGRARRARRRDGPGPRCRVGGSDTYTLALSGGDADLLARHAAVVERELRTLPGIGQVTTRSSLQRPEVIVRPDPARA